MTSPARKRKLIEVALPLDEINAACKADKDRKTGTIRNLHKWFAPMPLPAWRALLFAAMIDDPEDDTLRADLLGVIKQLVANGADLPDDAALADAKARLRAQFPDGMPTVFDPFCGGGSTLIEAQRLGAPTRGSDLNPVPALITRTVTQILPKIWDGQPLHPAAVGDRARLARNERQLTFPAAEQSRAPLRGYAGIVQDVNHYAAQIQDRVLRRLSKNYRSQDGENVVAWLWARTARCPNPSCGIDTVLTTSWWLAKRKNELAWLEPIVRDGRVDITVESGRAHGQAQDSPKIGDGVFECLACKATLDGRYLRSQGKDGRLGLRMTAVVADVAGRRRYRAPTQQDLDAAAVTDLDSSFAAVPINSGGQGIRVGLYGVSTWDEIFSPRQRIWLTALADEVARVPSVVTADGGAQEWAVAAATLLGLAVGRVAQYESTQVRWFIDSRSGAGQALPAFGRHDVPMQWDFVEPAPSSVAGSFTGAVRSITAGLSQASRGDGVVVRQDARVARLAEPGLVATDPPYFDAIGYADHSDYFYIWHRRALKDVHPDLYGTAAAPKGGELTAIPVHHGNSKDAAREYFIEGFTEAFNNLQQSLRPDLPMLVVYASKEQKATKQEETRWSSILTAMIAADLEITGAWPIHGTGTNRMVGIGTNAVATYVVMTCRPRESTAMSISLTDFTRALRRELGPAVRDLQASSILPVDLAQAAMGPGMRIYSRYRAVLDQAGSRVPVEHAMRLINSALAEVLDEQEGELDPASRFAIRWWETYGWEPGTFGEADKAARPLGIGVDDVVRSQVATSRANKVQLRGSGAMDPRWTPTNDIQPTAWEAVHHLAHKLIDRGGELEAAELMASLGNLHDPAMALVYRLHDIAAKKSRAADQERYNALINSWSELVKLSKDASPTLEGLF